MSDYITLLDTEPFCIDATLYEDGDLEIEKIYKWGKEIDRICLPKESVDKLFFFLHGKGVKNV